MGRTDEAQTLAIVESLVSHQLKSLAVALESSLRVVQELLPNWSKDDSFAPN